MTPGVFNLPLYRGDSYYWRFTAWKNVGRTDPVDLTIAEVSAQIRDRPDGLVVADLPIAVLDPNGIDMWIDPPMYGEIPRTGVWDLQIVMDDGSVHTFLRGSVTVTLDVTVVGSALMVMSAPLVMSESVTVPSVSALPPPKASAPTGGPRVTRVLETVRARR